MYFHPPRPAPRPHQLQTNDVSDRAVVHASSHSGHHGPGWLASPTRTPRRPHCHEIVALKLITSSGKVQLCSSSDSGATRCHC
eukprot:2481474-Karenia_brevis.AAC.1